MRIQFSHKFEEIISLDNLLAAWKEFIKGKRNKKDVQEFQFRLMDNIINLHEDLKNRTYQHSDYHALNISDPKPRSIHKATVRDRLLHRAIYRILRPFFDRVFIADSYSCRILKGTHKALNRFRAFAYKASKNHTKTIWVLKCDVRKFFANIGHSILLQILKKYIKDENIQWLLSRVVESFSSHTPGIGLPLGNLTSQLFINIYMNEFDQFVKHKLKAKYYIRYADDFVIMNLDKNWLDSVLVRIKEFLKTNLKLELHPDKISLRTISSGNDFLGWVHFPDHRVLRGVTKKRMFRNIIAKNGKTETVQSYLGLLQYGNTKKLQGRVKGMEEK